MMSTVEDQERKDQPATGAGSDMVAMEKKVVMQTALLSVGCNDKFCETRALFDTESTRTYITEELAKVLKAKPVEKQTVSVHSFGSTKAKEKTSPVVELAIKIKTGKAIKIKATIMPQITSRLKRVPIQLENQRRIQKDYPLATAKKYRNIHTCTADLQ